MATTTNHPAPDATTEERTHGPLTEAATRRESAIAEYDELLTSFEEARGHGDKALTLSIGAKMAIRSARIGDAELDMAENGETFEEWVKPVTSKKASRQAALSQTEIEASLVKAGRVYKAPMSEKQKVGADKRIEALLKAAAKRGYKVADPRK